jgi:hypothetical protein
MDTPNRDTGRDHRIHCFVSDLRRALDQATVVLLAKGLKTEEVQVQLTILRDSKQSISRLL